MDTHGFPDTLPYDFADEPGGPIEPPRFTPVPMQRKRRNGWTPAKQRAFIAALCQWGSAAAAARAVGMSARSAYRLLDKDHSLSFARAWDRAVDMARERLRADSLGRALHGSFVPVYRKGRLVRVEHRRNDRLAVALLSGRDEQSIAEVAQRRRTGAERRSMSKQTYRDYDSARAAVAAANAAWEDAQRQVAEACEALEAVRRRACSPRVLQF